MREATGLPSANFIGGGTLVMNPQGRNIVLQAPHPVSDLYTGRQAVDTYLSVDAGFLLLPGTRRDNSPEFTDCTDGSYRQSDASHHTTQLFYIAHEQLSLSDPERIFLQFHGFGTSSLNTLQEQCGTDNNLLINLSEGVQYPSDPNAATFMHTLRRYVEGDGLISTCVYGNDTSYLGATSTTTGRFTNGSLNACDTNATESSQRWVHLEQSYTIRSQYRKRMSNYIEAAIDEYFSAQ